MNENYISICKDKLGIAELNEMQKQFLGASQREAKIILLSPTGSGKTLAFLVPLIESIDRNSKFVQALIMVPSRELALQIEGVFKQLQTGFKISACYGGHKREIEEKNLTEAPAVIIGTAGRMADHLRRGNFNASQIKFLVLDEFDKSLELGFLEEMKFILNSLPAINKRILTSASNHSEMPEFAQMSDAHVMDFLPLSEEKKENLRIHIVESADKDKVDTLFNMLCYFKGTSSIIFCNHRDAVERVSKFLGDSGITNVFYHGGMEQHDREVALTKFRNSTSDNLVTTDLAGRGLDIANIRNIVHYHLPLDETSFTHRNGRTARMNKTGNVYVIKSDDEKLPGYITAHSVEFILPNETVPPEKPKWTTLFIAAGKKDKINKIDIVGFLSNKGQLKKDEIGLIEVKDFTAFAAIRKSKAGSVIELIKDEKIKGKKIKMAVAK